MWVLALCAATLMLGAMETGLRVKGHTPSINDTPETWAYWRSKVYANGPKTIAIIGNSRAQTDLDPAILEKFFPDHRVIHLAINGTNSFAGMKSLMQDPRFKGIILSDFMALTELSNKEIQGQESWTEIYETEWQDGGRYNKALNVKIKLFLESRLVILNSLFRLTNILKGQVPAAPKHLSVFRADRFRPLLFEKRTSAKNIADIRENRIEIINRFVYDTGPEQIERFINELAPGVEALRSRGGKLIFIRLPTKDAHWQKDQENFPRTQWWDVIIKKLDVPGIHFRDYPELAKFDCPDTSHLSTNGAGVFTRYLAKILKPYITGAQAATPPGVTP